ncbi:hypothetical protein ACFQXA_26240 [Nocardiopsis composta]
MERVHDDLADPRRGLRVWRQTDPGEWRPHPVGRDKVVHVDRLGHRAVQAVLDAERGWAHDLGSELLIEVALPLDLLALEVEAWPYPLLGSGFIVELGDHYRMVLRGLEEQMAPVYHRRLRWGALKSGGRPRVHWVDGEGSRNGALQHRMREDRRSVVAVLEPGAADPLGEKGMYYALAHGFPFLLWDRRGRLDRSFCDRLEQALGEEEDARTAALRVHGAVDRLRRPPGERRAGGASTARWSAASRCCTTTPTAPCGGSPRRASRPSASRETLRWTMRCDRHGGSTGGPGTRGPGRSATTCRPRRPGATSGAAPSNRTRPTTRTGWCAGSAPPAALRPPGRRPTRSTRRCTCGGRCW